MFLGGVNELIMRMSGIKLYDGMPVFQGEATFTGFSLRT